jgi:alpha-tubulin suppressor-like RCC1 family protein
MILVVSCGARSELDSWNASSDACPIGFSDCDAANESVCDTRTSDDNSNCGVCGNICPGGTICANGQCHRGNDPVQVAAAESVSCLRTANGRVACWGWGPFGELGNASYGQSSVPIFVTGVDDAIELTVGPTYTCALKRTGSLLCWGTDYYGLFGQDPGSGRTIPPTSVPIVARPAHVTTAGDVLCALDTMGRTSCWGNLCSPDDAGCRSAIGLSSAYEVVPILLNIPRSRAIASTCAVTTTSSLLCWRGSAFDDTTSALPVQHPPPSVAYDVSTVTIATDVDGWGTACFVDANGHATCRESADARASPNPTPIPLTVPAQTADVVETSVGEGFACVRMTSGAIDCWGNNVLNGHAGMLGGGSFEQLNSPVHVAGIHAAISLASGRAHTCAVLVDGEVACWGANDHGQLGNSTTVSSAVPVPVSLQ